MRIIFPAVVAIIGLLLASSGNAETAAEMKEARFARWIHAGLLDPQAPIEQRRAIVGELETLASDDSDPDVLYLLGSLYRQDPAHSSSPLEQNLDRARELLARAALHGKIIAMAKLSTIELKAGNRFEANVWAQLYFHYEMNEAQSGLLLKEGLTAVILHRALDGFPEQEMDALNTAVGGMIDQYDGQISKGQEALMASAPVNRFTDMKMGEGMRTTGYKNGRLIESGMSEYVVELGANGRVTQLWVLDAWPDYRLAKDMRKIALSLKVTADNDEKILGRVMILPINYDNLRYKLRGQSGSH